MKTALVCGAGGFIGSHLVRRLKEEDYFVLGVDLKYPEFSPTVADAFFIKDLRYPEALEGILHPRVNEVYQLAADMGGAGYIFTGEHDASIMSSSALINLNVLGKMVEKKVKKVFFSSSACIYPAHNQLDSHFPNCEESSAYPAAPDSEYGWEKLFSERLYLSFARNYGINARIARFHNIYGPEGTYNNGKEKAPAAMCRKVIEAEKEGFIEVWGDGNQSRSFLYIDECIEGVRRLMEYYKSIPPVNIGSDEMITINDLLDMVMSFTGKTYPRHNISGPLGVRGRCSDNRMIKTELGWVPNYPLYDGMKKTFEWIKNQYGK